MREKRRLEWGGLGKQGLQRGGSKGLQFPMWPHGASVRWGRGVVRIKDRKRGQVSGFGLGFHPWEIPPSRTLGWSVGKTITCCRPPAVAFFWWFPSWVTDPVLGLSIPDSDLDYPI